MKPRICPTCTLALNRETRHAAHRRCSQVQSQRRYLRTAKGRKANRKAQAAHRARRKGDR